MKRVWLFAFAVSMMVGCGKAESVEVIEEPVEVVEDVQELDDFDFDLHQEFADYVNTYAGEGNQFWDIGSDEYKLVKTIEEDCYNRNYTILQYDTTVIKGTRKVDVYIGDDIEVDIWYPDTDVPSVGICIEWLY